MRRRGNAFLRIEIPEAISLTPFVIEDYVKGGLCGGNSIRYLE